MNILAGKNISKFYEDDGARIHVLDEINLEIPQSESGKIISILAPEGSGKSSLLKILSKIEEPSSGEAASSGVVPLIPEKPSSYLWLNVRENINIVEKLSGNKIEKNIDKIISLVGLTGYEDRIPHEKSLGFRFRISLARSLAVSPKIILIDNSLKFLSPESRGEIHNLLLTIIDEINISILLATTNISEAIKLSHKIYLMSSRPGKIFQEIMVDKDLKNNNEYFVQLRRKIENYFIEEKVINNINFSV